MSTMTLRGTVSDLMMSHRMSVHHANRLFQAIDRAGHSNINLQDACLNVLLANYIRGMHTLDELKTAINAAISYDISHS